MSQVPTLEQWKAEEGELTGMLSPIEVSKYLRVHRRTVYRWLFRDDVIPPEYKVQVGKTWRINSKWLNNQGDNNDN